ncbi:glycosyltransferase [Sorangium cellulosum]|uniref:Glycosyltransferase n=1 Tax=Sorangium cellulosum TaxID=56 RepID=A0A2L0F6M2_SORCE|nr:glycosyltransferase family 4 protein [Sorangium cellulosum]AUX47161.1 glycosyltransferase [Sorangium cellulosum]
MRILYVSPYFPPEPGAPAARVSELARAWQRAGHEVTVLTGMPNHPTGVIPPDYQGRIRVEEDFHGVRVLRTWIYAAANRGKVRRSLAYGSFALSALTLAQVGLPQADVLIATSPQFLSAAAGYGIAALRRLPFVFEVRDLWPESIVAVGALPADHAVVRGLTLVEEHLYRVADEIVVVTQRFRERLVERGVPAEKIEIIRNGVDLGRFTPASRDTPLRARLGFGERVVVAYVGTHGMAHGLSAVLDVASGLRARDDIRFLFVGEGAERASLEARARQLGLTNVTFLGALSRDLIPEVYATADICLVPLRKAELFQTVIPSKIFEILGMARPIVISVDGEARSIIEEARAGIFAPPEDVPAMTESIVDLASDPAKRGRMGEDGRAYVIRSFDRDTLAREYVDLLERVLRRADRARR